jgi:serpin B
MKMNSEEKKKSSRLRKLIIFSIPAAAAIVLCIVLLSNVFGSSVVYAQDLMKNTKPSKVDAVKLSDDFIRSAADFSIELFKKSITEDENSMISPTSVYLALAMTANGAEGKTLEEFKTLLGKYSLTVEDINRYCYSFSKYLTDLKNGKLSIANSIWYRQDEFLKVKESFLQANADYYSASAYKADFNSPKTIDDINNWVKMNTGKLIDGIIDKIDSDTVMYLINAICFEDRWMNVYSKEQIQAGDFMLGGDKVISADFMYSEEALYLEDQLAKGFMKPYEDGKYSFAALLPNEGVSVDEYILSLSGEKFLSLIRSRKDTSVNTGLPKFKSEYSKELVEPLKAMGLSEGFNSKSADFTRMAASDRGNIYIGDVLHKTYIAVDELGTKAGAVTKVEMRDESAALEVKSIILNRPFVYAIVDNETGLPVFIGVMRNPK